MRPIFTIHAGEYLVGDYLEKKFKDYRVWLPSKDTGVDLLVTDKGHRKAVSLQVKFSKDFMGNNFKAIGWWTLKSEKITKSLADLWVFALYTFEEKNIHNVIIPPNHLLEILQALHGPQKLFQSCCLSVGDAAARPSQLHGPQKLFQSCCSARAIMAAAATSTGIAPRKSISTRTIP